MVNVQYNTTTPDLCVFHVDINECKTDPCHVSGECSNTVGTFACTCLDGFLGDGFTCEGRKTFFFFFSYFLLNDTQYNECYSV